MWGKYLIYICSTEQMEMFGLRMSSYIFGWDCMDGALGLWTYLVIRLMYLMHLREDLNRLFGWISWEKKLQMTFDPCPRLGIYRCKFFQTNFWNLLTKRHYQNSWPNLWPIAIQNTKKMQPVFLDRQWPPPSQFFSPEIHPNGWFW